VVPGAEGLLLHDRGQRLRNNSFAGDHTDSSADSIPNTATHAAAHSTSDAAPTHFAATTASPSWTRGSLQLRSGPILQLGPSQTAVVLQNPSHLWPTDASTCPSRPLQLPGWLFQLAGWLVCSQEGVVLSGPWQGLPEPGWWLRDVERALRLRRWICQLDGWVVSGEEGLVLFEQGQGLPACSRRMCLSGRDWQWPGAFFGPTVMKDMSRRAYFLVRARRASSLVLAPSSGEVRLSA